MSNRSKREHELEEARRLLVEFQTDAVQLHKRIDFLEKRAINAETQLSDRRETPRFLLATFRGRNGAGKRHTFDVHAIPVDEGYGFSLVEGYTDIEVDIREIR